MSTPTPTESHDPNAHAGSPEVAQEVAEELGPRPMPTSQAVFLRALRWGIIMTVVLIAAFAGIGWLVAEGPGLVGGVIGTGVGGLMLLLTVGSIAFANRFIESPAYIAVFFGIVLGSWVIKFIIFIVLVVLLRDQTWLDTKVMFLGLIASIVLSLVLDVLLVTKSRIPIAVSGV